MEKEEINALAAFTDEEKAAMIDAVRNVRAKKAEDAEREEAAAAIEKGRKSWERAAAQLWGEDYVKSIK